MQGVKKYVFIMVLFCVVTKLWVFMSNAKKRLPKEMDPFSLRSGYRICALWIKINWFTPFFIKWWMYTYFMLKKVYKMAIFVAFRKQSMHCRLKSIKLQLLFWSVFLIDAFFPFCFLFLHLKTLYFFWHFTIEQTQTFTIGLG